MTHAKTLVPLLFLFIGSATMAIEEPDYEVLFETAEYEVRRYEPYIVAEVDVQGDFRESGNDAFRILAAYIFGENVPGEKMEMTAPVESRSAAKGTRMAMTAPVVSRDADSDAYTYGFVMEQKYTMDSLPRPKDPRVRLRHQPSRIMAVRKYSGSWAEKNYRRNESALVGALDAHGVEVKGGPILARYNSPFTPWFLRRNEVMIEVEWCEDAATPPGTTI